MKFSIEHLEFQKKELLDRIGLCEKSISRYEEQKATAAASILEYRDRVEEIKIAIDLLKKHEVK